MALAKGPGEGYHAAKSDVLARKPAARCKVAYNADASGIIGHFVIDGYGKVLGSGRLARDAWSDALARLEARDDD